MGDRAYTNNNTTTNPRPTPSAPTPPPPHRAININGGATTAQANGVRLPPAGPSRLQPPPAYRPKPPLPPPRRRTSRRRCTCRACFCWSLLAVLLLALLAAAAGAVLYVIYHPQLPSFAVTSLRLTALNVSDSDAVTANLNFYVTARNPNSKIAFEYSDVDVTVTADGADVGDGVVPGFVQTPGNVTVVRGNVSASEAPVDPTAAANLRSKKTHAMAVELSTKAGVQIGKFNSTKIGIRITCTGFTVSLEKPTPSTPAVVAVPPAAAAPSSLVAEKLSMKAVASSDAKCDIKVKIWSWYF